MLCSYQASVSSLFELRPQSSRNSRRRLRLAASMSVADAGRRGVVLELDCLGRGSKLIRILASSVDCIEAGPAARRWARCHLAPCGIARARGVGHVRTRTRARDRYLDLHSSEDRKLLYNYAAQRRPVDFWTSPECRTFTPVPQWPLGATFSQRAAGTHVMRGRWLRPMQNVTMATKRKAGNRRWRPVGEQLALDLSRYLKKPHGAQQKRGGRSSHEQSASSRAPCDGGEWPWAISSGYAENSTCVAGCAVGLLNREGALLAKQWRVESTSARLLAALAPYKCSGGPELSAPSARIL